MTTFETMNDLSFYLAYETLKYLAENGPSVPAKEAYENLNECVKKLDVSDELLGSYKSHDGPAYIIATNFKLVGYAKAGLIKKSSPKRGYWTITEEGLALAKKNPPVDEVNKHIHTKYWEWRKQQPDSDHKITPTEDDTNDEVSRVMTIREKLLSLDAYEFQDLTAGLLEGMGYFVDFNAPRGKDGGVDLVCYKDPLGAEIPRIKVQCKHMPEAKIPRAQIAQFAGVINNNDEIGIFVTSGFYSTDAKRYAIEKNVHIRLIDGQELEDMWAKFYDKIPTEKQSLMPIVFVPQLVSAAE